MIPWGRRVTLVITQICFFLGNYYPNIIIACLEKRLSSQTCFYTGQYFIQKMFGYNMRKIIFLETHLIRGEKVSLSVCLILR